MDLLPLSKFLSSTGQARQEEGEARLRSGRSPSLNKGGVGDLEHGCAYSSELSRFPQNTYSRREKHLSILHRRKSTCQHFAGRPLFLILYPMWAVLVSLAQQQLLSPSRCSPAGNCDKSPGGALKSNFKEGRTTRFPRKGDA